MMNEAAEENEEQAESPLSQNSQFLAFVAGRDERSDSQLWNQLVDDDNNAEEES